MQRKSSYVLIVIFVLMLLLGFTASRLAVMSSAELQDATYEIDRLKGASLSKTSVVSIDPHRYLVLIPSDRIFDSWVIDTSSAVSRHASESANGVWWPTVTTTQVGEFDRYVWNSEDGRTQAVEYLDHATNRLVLAYRRSAGGDSMFVENEATNVEIRINVDCTQKAWTTVDAEALAVGDDRLIPFKNPHPVECSVDSFSGEWRREPFGEPIVDPVKHQISFALPWNEKVVIETTKLPEGISIVGR